MGNKIEENIYNTDGSLRFKYTYKYNDKGDFIEKISFKTDVGSDYKKTYKYIYEYDKTGNWITKTVFENEKPESIFERELVYY